jgi:hypothetical protein
VKKISQVALLSIITSISYTSFAKLTENNESILELGNIESIQDAEWDAIDNSLDESDEGLAVLEEDIDEEEDIFLHSESLG